jgi:alpha/beta superfamily hydrolase
MRLFPVCRAGLGKSAGLAGAGIPGAGHFFHGKLIKLGQMIQRCW